MSDLLHFIYVLLRCCLVRKASVNRALQKCVSVALRTCIVYLSQYPKLGGHPREGSMYDIMRLHLFWLYIANDVLMTVERHGSCAQNGFRKKHEGKLQNLQAAGSLESVLINILGLLAKSPLGNQQVVIMAYYYSKLSRAIPTTKLRRPIFQLYSSIIGYSCVVF